MIGSLLYAFGVVLVGFYLYKIGRYIFTTIQQAVERWTAPEIKLAPPPAPARSESASLSPLRPQIQDQPDMIQCFDKGTNAPLGTVRVVTKDNLEDIMRRARTAQEKWAKTSFSTRRKLLFSLLNYVIKHQKEICETSSIECGKTMMDGALGEILTTLEKLRWTCAQGEDVLAEEVRDVGLITIHKRASVSYLPIGVVGAIVSWNYPFHNIYGPMISALFAGNAFVGKVSEYASYYAKYYQDIVREGLVALGQSPDLVHFITGFAATGEALVETADKITFIGSPAVGKKVMEKASKTLTPVVLELGGKDPAIILEDADLKQVVPIMMRGTFQNCGQNCVGLERIVAHTAIHDKLVEALKSKVEKLSQGAPSCSVKDLGAMTMGELSVNKIQKLVDESVAAGAKLVVGGKATSKNFFPATMLINVTKDMPIAQEEVFGPVLVVFRFKTDDEAVDIVNGCPYGLGSNIFSANIPRAQAIAKRLKTGMVNINDFAINYLCQSLPFGGTKISGFDRFAGVEGLRGNCLVRSQTVDRIPGVKTEIPPVLQYPITEKSFQFMMLLVQVLYGNVVQFVAAGLKLATFKA